MTSKRKFRPAQGTRLKERAILISDALIAELTTELGGTFARGQAAVDFLLPHVKREWKKTDPQPGLLYPGSWALPSLKTRVYTIMQRRRGARYQVVMVTADEQRAMIADFEHPLPQPRPVSLLYPLVS